MTKWEQLQKKMQAILSKEIGLRQELLAAMQQQEHVLLIGDLTLKEELHEVSDTLVKHLKKVTKIRMSLTHQLLQGLYSNPTGMRLNEVLNPLVDMEAETLLLYQKTKILIDKMHGQHLRNKTLKEMTLKDGPLQVRNDALFSEIIEAKEKKKTPLITIDYHANEDPI